MTDRECLAYLLALLRHPRHSAVGSGGVTYAYPAEAIDEAVARLSAQFDPPHCPNCPCPAEAFA